MSSPSFVSFPLIDEEEARGSSEMHPPEGKKSDLGRHQACGKGEDSSSALQRGKEIARGVLSQRAGMEASDVMERIARGFIP